jgi:SAM-dependent methyltransferase
MENVEIQKSVCLVCSSEPLKDKGSRLLGVFFCRECNVFTTLENADPRAYQEGNYSHYKASFFEKCIIRLNNLNQIKIVRGLPITTWLDFGCGKGLFLKALDRHFGVVGWEADNARASSARKENPEVEVLDAILSSEHGNQIGNRRFDVISLMHVLEHLDDLSVVDNLAKHYLSKNGRFLIEVPNINSFQAGLAGNRWLHLDLPIHRTHWGMNGLDQFFLSLGFVRERQSTFSLTEGVFGMADTLFFHSAGQSIYSFLKGGLLNKTVALPVLVIAAFFEILTSLLGRGGVLRVVYRRNV